MKSEEFEALVLEGEKETVDFKAFYDWAHGGKSEVAEFSKDVMAIANLLPPGTTPGHILLGVEEFKDSGASGGRITGLSPQLRTSDSASMTQRLQRHLNSVPRIEYEELQVPRHDDESVLVWVGVLTIRPGGRPYYAKREYPNKLIGGVAYRRAGTSTQIATPRDIELWLVEDQRLDPAKLDLEKRKLEAEIAGLRGAITPVPFAKFQDAGGRGQAAKVSCSIRFENHGMCPYRAQVLDLAVGRQSVDGVTWTQVLHASLDFGLHPNTARMETFEVDAKEFSQASSAQGANAAVKDYAALAETLWIQITLTCVSHAGIRIQRQFLRAPVR